MKNQYHDSFVNPVGSVPSIDVELPSYEAPSTVTDVYGKYGKLRHSGKFSSDNPVLLQLEAATSNQDKDTLYELAVKWEIDHDTDLRQQELNRYILEEQREYDSPLSQIAREREAGINPDIASGSSSGTSSGSAQMSPVDLGRSATQNTTKFSNVYDNASLVMQGISTASNLIGAFSSVGSTVVDGISTLASLPSQISLNTANAALATQQANNLSEMLPLSKAAAALDNVGKTISLVGGISEMLSDDSTDDDISSLFTNLGVESSLVPQLVQATKTYRDSPQMQAYYANNSLSNKKAQSANSAYTASVCEKLAFAAMQLEQAQIHYDNLLTGLRSSFVNYLSSSNYAKQASDNVIGLETLKVDQIKYSRKMLEHDLKAFEKNVSAIDDFVKKSEDYVAYLRSEDRRFNGFCLNGKKKVRPLTPEEEGIIRAEEQNQLWLRSLRSNVISQSFAIARQTAQHYYQSDNFVGGQLDSYINFNGVNPIKFYMSNAFALPGQQDDNSTPHNGLANAILSEIPVVGAVVNAIY